MLIVTTLLVGLVHVVGMVLVLGGVVFAWATLRVGGPGRVDASGSTASDGDQTPFATFYELVFWAAMGAMAIAGVGNPGVLGPPGPSERWGLLLTAKLLAVTAFVLGSFVRTFVMFRLRWSGLTGLGRSLLAKSYGVTAAVFLVLVTLTEVLAYGWSHRRRRAAGALRDVGRLVV